MKCIKYTVSALILFAATLYTTAASRFFSHISLSRGLGNLPFIRTLSNLGHPSIRITDSAWDRMSQIIKDQTEGSYFGFSAKGGGCGGFNYALKIIHSGACNKNGQAPPSVLNRENVTVMIDPISEVYLWGTTIDFVSENHTEGVFESKFVFIPDKDRASCCGCGKSFSPKD